MSNPLPGYIGRVLRVNLTSEIVTESSFDEVTLKQYIGGVGLGAKVLYDEVAPGVEWSDSQNRLIFATGPLNGTNVAGSGTFSVVTKGCLTNGGTSSQANGYLGAYFKFSGIDALIIHGAARRWLYLYVHDGTAELRDAAHLIGRDTTETQQLLKAELGKKGHEVSIYCIGPAGENLVRYAAIVGDGGHCVAHNGVGAVMGSKKLKAIVADRGKMRPIIKDQQRLYQLGREMNERAKANPASRETAKLGTSRLFPLVANTGILPIRNLTTNVPFADPAKFVRDNYPSHFEMKWTPCWACPSHHVQTIKMTAGPYAGLEAEDPEYECVAAWSYLTGNDDLEAAIMLCDLTDRLGLDCNEAGWTMALVIECFEKGIINKADTGGLEMTWGNVAAIKAMLDKIARREGVGDFLAEGVMRTAQHIGGEAPNLGVYVKKGHSPRGHDARARWSDILDYATGGVGTTESNPGPAGVFTPEGATEAVVKGKIRAFVDSLVVCDFSTMSYSSNDVGHLVNMLNAITGWDFTQEEAAQMAQRVTNLFRVFNIRHGMTPEVEEPSLKYGSAPVNGPAQGKSIMTHWKELLDEHYQIMGWDRASGKPLPDTLKKLGLEAVIADIWG